MTATPRRLVICVDGTWLHPDGGPMSSGTPGNITNVYRLFASIYEGEVADETGKRFLQQRLYVPGIGSDDDLRPTKRLLIGAFGKECLPQIRNVYRECCKLSGPDDEVWLYGFSRGAFVVRAVAGLLHGIRALRAADGDNDVFEKDYQKAVKGWRTMGAGQIHRMLATITRPAPRIRLVGAFETVKAVKKTTASTSPSIPRSKTSDTRWP